MRSEKKFLVSYVKFLKKFLKPERELKVVFDCSNGTTGIILKELFKNSKITAIILNSKPDGNFPAHGPNPMAKGAAKQLEKEVLKRKADLGVIFDADGDRVFFVDGRGRSVDPDEAGLILARRHRGPYVIGANSGRLLSGQPKTYRSKVGHYFIKRLMRKKKANLGMERSGHFYFKKFFYSDSGVLAAIEVMNFVSLAGQAGLKSDLADWLDGLPKYFRSGEKNLKVKDKEKILRKIEKIYGSKKYKISKLDGLTVEFKGGWFNLRPSQTEDLLRLNAEAEDKKLLEKELGRLKALLI